MACGNTPMVKIGKINNTIKKIQIIIITCILVRREYKEKDWLVLTKYLNIMKDQRSKLCHRSHHSARYTEIMRHSYQWNSSIFH